MDDDSSSERRTIPRQRTVRAAVSWFNGPASPIPCVLIDLSALGARINVHRISELPDEFLLIVEAQKLEQRCRVVWRLGDEIGVQFIA